MIVPVLLAVPSFGWAQKAEKGDKAAGKAGSPSEELAMAIQFNGKELLDIAEDKQYPDAKLDYKPMPEMRSFAEQLLHAAKANMMFLDFVNGKKPDFADLKRADYKTRADIVKVLKQSIDDLAATTKKLGDKGMQKTVKLPFIPMPVTMQTALGIAVGHMSEHYGQLVVYERLNKVVPPATRNQGTSPASP
jgi:uncharacterized damage-inducible protein DinB